MSVEVVLVEVVLHLGRLSRELIIEGLPLSDPAQEKSKEEGRRSRGRRGVMVHACRKASGWVGELVGG